MASFFSNGFFGFGKKRSSTKKFARDLDDDTDKEKSYPRAKSTGLFKGQFVPRPKIFSWIEINLVPVCAWVYYTQCLSEMYTAGTACDSFCPCSPTLAEEAWQAFPAPTQNALSVSIFALFWPLFSPFFRVLFVVFSDHRLILLTTVLLNLCVLHNF